MAEIKDGNKTVLPFSASPKRQVWDYLNLDWLVHPLQHKGFGYKGNEGLIPGEEKHIV